MERARVRRAVAEERDGDALLAAHLEGERGADDSRQPAADDGVRAEIADLDVVQMHRAAVAPAAAFDLAVQLGHDPLDGRSLRDRVTVRAMRRRDDVLARERGTDPGRGRLLADRDVQEPRQLARAEPILDLLLEATDQEHLAEESAQNLPGYARPPGLGALFDGRHRAAIMLIRRCGLPTSGTRSRRGSRPTGRKSSSRSPRKDRSRTRPPCSVLCSQAVVGNELRLHIQRVEGGVERARNVFRRLDQRRIWGILSVVGVVHDVAPATPRAPIETTRSLAAQWDEALAELPPDWSDILCVLELDSTDHLPRAALLGAPLNPSRVPGEIALRFRASGKQGYGVSPQMARRCLERMDAEGITGSASVLYGLSDTENAVTQGPVWRLAGRSV